MIRRRFIRALSGAILTTLLGVKAWRLEASEEDWDSAPWSVIGSPSLPTDPREGDRFWNSATGKTHTFIEGEWVPDPAGRIGYGLLARSEP